MGLRLGVLAEDPFCDRFSASEYEEDEPVDVKAFRGTRAASIHREHVVPERLFERILLLASAYELHVLPALDQYGPHELSQQQAETVAEELAFLQPVVNDGALAPHLTALRDLAVWCARSGESSWMHIEGRSRRVAQADRKQNAFGARRNARCVTPIVRAWIAPEDGNEFIEGLRNLVDEAIDALQMHIVFLHGRDPDSKALAQSYLQGVVDFIRDAEAWADRFVTRNGERS